MVNIEQGWTTSLLIRTSTPKIYVLGSHKTLIYPLDRADHQCVLCRHPSPYLATEIGQKTSHWHTTIYERQSSRCYTLVSWCPLPCSSSPALACFSDPLKNACAASREAFVSRYMASGSNARSITSSDTVGAKRSFAKQTLAAVFHAWRNPSAFPISAPSPSVWRKLCDHSIAFHAAMAQRFSRQVTRGVRADDKAFYEGLAQRQGAIAADEGLPSFWKSIKPLLPKSRKKQRSNIRCTGPEPSELCTHYNQLWSRLSMWLFLSYCYNVSTDRNKQSQRRRSKWL